MFLFCSGLFYAANRSMFVVEADPKQQTGGNLGRHYFKEVFDYAIHLSLVLDY